MTAPTTIRNTTLADLDPVIALDEFRPDDEKLDYWQGIFERFVTGERSDRIFLVAETGGAIVGFIIGEVRAWEFGSPRCGWVFAIAVTPSMREQGVGQQLFDEICSRLREAGVTTVRTMVNRENRLTLSFFRGMGLRTGPFIELEKQLD